MHPTCMAPGASSVPAPAAAVAGVSTVPVAYQHVPAPVAHGAGAPMVPAAAGGGAGGTAAPKLATNGAFSAPPMSGAGGAVHGLYGAAPVPIPTSDGTLASVPAAAPAGATGIPPDLPPHHQHLFSAILAENRTLRDMCAYLSESNRTLTARQSLSEAQCQTHWELLSRIHDMLVVFDMAGIIVFISPMCEQILQYKPEELFNKPLAHCLAEDGHAEFEASMRKMMAIQSTRPLVGDELISLQKFTRKDGSQVWLEGKGQAWQRGDVIEFVIVYRELLTAPRAPVPTDLVPAAATMGGPGAPSTMATYGAAAGASVAADTASPPEDGGTDASPPEPASDEAGAGTGTPAANGGATPSS